VTGIAGARRSWTGLHCFLDRVAPDVDTFVVDTLAPTLDRLRHDGRIADRFFIRYAEGGPHVRVRVADAAPGVVSWLSAELTRTGAATASTPPDVVEVEYVPEIDRYGGPAAIAEAEDVFCRSTDVAVRVLADAGTVRARLAAATDLVIATAFALGLDRLGTGRWLRTHAAGWRWQDESTLLPPALGETRTVAVLADQTPALQRRWDAVARRVSGRVSGPARPVDPVRTWADTVRASRRRLEADAAGAGADSDPAPARWLTVWASHLHMLLNRIGVAPDEERSLCRLVAGTAVLPDGIVPFFADGATAPDRAYQEASKYLPGRLDAQRPHSAAPAPAAAAALRRGAAVPLPGTAAGLGPLADALRRRRSGRGRLAGPVTAADLGTLLRHAAGPVAAGPTTRMPYPSGGRQYPARLRLVARDVVGLAPGTYEVDPARVALLPIGPAPSTVDLEATSMWFGASAPEVGGVDAGTVPAVLGLYVQTAAMRARYGLRALRFALLEAGHLAQNLALVAAATGLELGLIGGFYDDLANEVFGLDGIDRFLAYLLPIGHRP
jgi:thiopeptide-type bacteriocin biosynthesis protein